MRAIDAEGSGREARAEVPYVPAAAQSCTSFESQGRTNVQSAKLDFNGNSTFGFDTGPLVVNGVLLANGNQSRVPITNPADTVVKRTPLHLTN